MISNGITLENYMSSQLEPSDFGEHTLVLTFDQAAKEKVLEMEGAQNVEVLTELTGDELEILDPYGAELVTYGKIRISVMLRLICHQYLIILRSVILRELLRRSNISFQMQR